LAAGEFITINGYLLTAEQHITDLTGSPVTAFFT
jgi:hypothetical protein